LTFYFPSWSSGQGGLIFDDAAYAQVPKWMVVSQGSQFAGLPISISFRAYTPPPKDQKSDKTCVAWSMAYGAYSTMKALYEGEGDKEKIEALAYSAMYPHICIKRSPRVGMTFNEMVEFLVNKGDCLYQDYPVYDPDTRIPDELHRKALAFRIAGYNALFEQNANDSVKLGTIQQALSISKPVVIGLKTDKTFKNLQSNKWEPEEDIIAQHAVLVIGYNRVLKQFELMNSQGDTWGDNGYCYVSYEDLLRRIKYAYILNIGDEEDKMENLAGSFALQYPQKDGSDDFHFEEAEVEWLGNAQYELLRKDWRVNDLFQFILRDCQEGKYAYVFSIDSKGNLGIHLPRVEQYGNGQQFMNQNESPRIPFDNAEIIVPSEYEGLALTSVGTDNLIVLYTAKELVDFHNKVQEVRNAEGSIYERLQTVWGDQLVEEAEVEYISDRITFNANVASNKIVPVILSVETIR